MPLKSGKELREMVIKVTMNLTEQCEATSKSKARSTDTTPESNIIPKLLNTPEGYRRVVNADSNVNEKSETEIKEVHFTPGPHSEIPADLTTKPQPDQVHLTWEERTWLCQLRDEELTLYGKTRI